MTEKAKEFVKANRKHNVISGAAFGKGGEGGSYTLSNGKTFKLSADDCRALPEGFPRWDFPEQEQVK